MMRAVLTASPEDTVQSARNQMKRQRVRHLPVITEEGELVGILSDRDLLGLFGRDGDPVSAVMTTEPVTVFDDTPAYEAAALLIHHRFGALPVIDANRRVIGIVTETDLLVEAHASLSGRLPVEPSAQQRALTIEHAVLRARLDHVRRARYPDSAVVALVELRRFLERHFAREESDTGLFARALRALPEAHGEVRALVSEHLDLLALIRTLEDDNKRLAREDSVQVGSGVDVLVQQLEAHEAEEAMLSRRLTTSLSGG